MSGHKTHSGYPLLGRDQCPECLYQKPAPRFVSDAERTMWTHNGIGISVDDWQRANATIAALLDGIEKPLGNAPHLVTAYRDWLNELRALAARVKSGGTSSASSTDSRFRGEK